MATFTSTEINALKNNPFGANHVRARWTATAGSFTVSDVVLMARLPNGATLIDWKVTGGTAGKASTVWTMGFQGSVIDAISDASLTADSLALGISLTGSGVGSAWAPIFPSASASLSGSLVNPPLWTSPRAVLPLKISLSDDATPRYVWIQMSPRGSTTATTSLQLIITYLMGE